MNKETLERAKEIEASIDCINDINNLIDKSNIVLRNYQTELYTEKMDKNTVYGLKEVMREYLTKRIDELEKEFKEL